MLLRGMVGMKNLPVNMSLRGGSSRAMKGQTEIIKIKKYQEINLMMRWVLIYLDTKVVVYLML